MLLRSGLLTEEVNQPNEASELSEDADMPLLDDNISNTAVAATTPRDSSTDHDNSSAASSATGQISHSDSRETSPILSPRLDEPSQGRGNALNLQQSTQNGRNQSFRGGESGSHRTQASNSSPPFTNSFTSQHPASGSTTSRRPTINIPINQGPPVPPEWDRGPPPWSPAIQTLPENRKRSLVEENPCHDLTDYPKDRAYKDKMEEDLDALHNNDDKQEGNGQVRKKAKFARNGGDVKTGSGSHEPRNYRKDMEDGRGEREGEGGMVV